MTRMQPRIGRGTGGVGPAPEAAGASSNMCTLFNSAQRLQGARTKHHRDTTAAALPVASSAPSPAPGACVRAVNGVLRVGLSQLDASKQDLNDSASWVVDNFFDAVRGCARQAGQAGGGRLALVVWVGRQMVGDVGMVNAQAVTHGCLYLLALAILQADLKSALTSTDYIPCWTGSSTFTLFRNQPVIDGG